MALIIMLSKALPGNITPHEAYFNQKPNIMLLQVFGCKAYVQVPAKYHNKLNACSIECVYLGYSENKKAYQVYDHKSKHFYESCNVIFDEGMGTMEHIELEVTSTVEGGMLMGKEKLESMSHQSWCPVSNCLLITQYPCVIPPI